MLSLVSVLAATAAAMTEKAAGLCVPRTVRVPISSQQPWCDVTADVTAALPSLPWSLCTINAGSCGGQMVLLDPSHLSLGPADVIAPNRRDSVTLAVQDGEVLLPDDVKLLVFPTDESHELELELRVEAAASLLSTQHSLLSGSEELARVALRTALAAQGVAPAEVHALESTADPSPAGRVYDSFVRGKAQQAAALVPAARRTAHHIGHLLREEAAAAAEYLRNNDAAVQAMRDGARPSHPLFLVLDNVRSAYNVGSIFRTADTAALAEVVTCGFTPHPPHPKLLKTAFGAVDSVPTRHVESTLSAIRSLQADGVAVYAMETTARSRNYAAVAFPREGAALVLGNEEIGVDTQVLAAVDGIVEIPTFGDKNSLNVASAAPIVIYEVLRQWGLLDGEPEG